MKYLSLVLLFSNVISFNCFSQVSTDNLSETELKIVNEIDSNIETSLNSLIESVNINSGTMNFEGVKKVGLHFKSELDALKFQTQWIDGSEFNRSGHLIASNLKLNSSINPNISRPKILLIGHLDTVFAKTDNFQTINAIDETHIAGPGITDMKGGDVIMISALSALNKLNLLKNVDIRVVLTGDEESSGRPLLKSKEAIVNAAKWADIALGFEDGDGDIKTAVTARRGATSWKLIVKGKAAHSSQIFREDIGYGAIFEASRILNSFREELSTQEYLTFNPGMIVGGTRVSLEKEKSSGETFGKSNVIAQDVIITGDIRALSVEQLKLARKTMQNIVSNNLAHTQAEISFGEGYPPMAPTAGNNQLLAYYSQISQDLGYGEIIAVDPSRAGAADISFAANYVEMSLDGLGLMGSGGHTKGEVADMESFAKNIKKAAILIYRLSKN